MKQYHYRGFQHANQLTEWLNKHQEIKVINVIYLERYLIYRAFYYIEDNISTDDVN